MGNAHLTWSRGPHCYDYMPALPGNLCVLLSCFTLLNYWLTPSFDEGHTLNVFMNVCAGACVIRDMWTNTCGGGGGSLTTQQLCLFFPRMKKRKLNCSCSVLRVHSQNRAINDLFTEGGRKDIKSAVWATSCNLWSSITAKRKLAWKLILDVRTKGSD